MFFERVQGNDVYNAALNPPFAYIPTATNVYFSNPNTSALDGTTTSQTFPSSLTNLAYNYSPPGTANFSLGVQRQLAPSIVGVFQYAGSLGWDQSDDRAVNTLPLTDPNNPTNPYGLRQGVAGGKLNANLYRIFPGFSSIQQEENETNFNYNSLQVGLRMENRHGLTTQVAYTYSHEIDEVSNDLGSVSNPFDIGVRSWVGIVRSTAHFQCELHLQPSIFRAQFEPGGAQCAGWMAGLGCHGLALGVSGIHSIHRH